MSKATHVRARIIAANNPQKCGKSPVGLITRNSRWHHVPRLLAALGLMLAGVLLYSRMRQDPDLLDQVKSRADSRQCLA